MWLSHIPGFRWSNILWGQRGNYLSVPTDCPQRNERLGWTGDAQIFFRTAAYNADVEDFYRKWLLDARDSQNEKGGYPDCIPYTRVVRFGNGAWADAGIIIPYKLYLMYGCRDLLEISIESMEHYMEFLSQYGLDGPNVEYGDWLAYEPTDRRYVSVAYYAYDAMLMCRMEKILGREQKAEEYRTLYDRIRTSWQRRYLEPDGTLTESSQTAYLLALMVHLFPKEREAAALEYLLCRIRENGYRLSTGFVGTGILMQTLSEYGQDDMAYNLLMQRENPSWLYSVDQGATTVWERWNSYTKASGFGNVRMNSFNHYAYGCVGEWMYRYMAGIETSEEYPGFERVILQPRPDLRREIPRGASPEKTQGTPPEKIQGTPPEKIQGEERITWVRASYDSRHGLIRIFWSLEEGVFIYRVSLEKGMKATLYLPISGGVREILRDGERVEYQVRGNCAVFELDSGEAGLEETFACLGLTGGE